MATNLGASKPETHMKEAGRVRGGGRISPPPLTLITYLPKKGLFLLIILASQTFYPNCPIFLYGYIRHIRDILQLCC